MKKPSSLKPCSLFTDGAVLCRGKEIRVFGEAETGRTVTAVLRDGNGRTVAEAECEAREGRFLALLAPQPARTGCTMTITDGETVFEAQDISVGDVFLAAGQSNMEWELRNAAEGPAEMAGHEDPMLRFYTVPRRAYVSREQRQAADGVRWEAVHAGGCGSCSAVAYFFARALRARHPDIPVGIIGCYWGGTSISCWLEEETLRRTAEGSAYLDRYAEEAGNKTMETYLEEEAVFQRTLNAWNAQVAEYREQHPGAPWKEVEGACGACPWNPPAGPGSPYRPGGLAEPMLMETVPAAMTGVLWYQGETDADLTEHYDEMLVLLIRRWRELFRDAGLPFLIVQLPMWQDWDAADTFRWPALRLAQAAVRDTVRNTGMICLLDEGEYGNLHPTAKRAVGERLHELAEDMIYGEDGKLSPRALYKRTEGGNLTVTVSSPVTVRGAGGPALMEIAGEDGEFHPAWGAVSGREIRLWAAEVPHPAAARYAWTDWSDRVNLFGENGLPLEPFLL